jgi:opacity protein-like surface antigen
VVNFTDKRALFAATHYQHDTSYTETMTLPIKAKAGVSFQVRPNFLVAADYEYSFSKYAKLVSKSGTTKPWTDASSFHFGIDWKPADIVSVRLGYRKQSEVLVAQSAAFNNDPVKYDAYTFGLGTEIISGLQLNVAYEFYELKYEDTWAESYNINRYHSNTISAGLSYTLQ